MGFSRNAELHFGEEVLQGSSCNKQSLECATLTEHRLDKESYDMNHFQRITFAYLPTEARIPIVDWFLANLDRRLEEHRVDLWISDMKFGRAGLDISWHLTGNVTEAFECELEDQFEWVCRKASKST